LHGTINEIVGIEKYKPYKENNQQKTVSVAQQWKKKPKCLLETHIITYFWQKYKDILIFAKKNKNDSGQTHQKFQSVQTFRRRSTG